MDRQDLEDLEDLVDLVDQVDLVAPVERHHLVVLDNLVGQKVQEVQGALVVQMDPADLAAHKDL